MTSQSEIEPMEATARALVAPGKGILAADESFPTIEQRFSSINLPSTDENRRAYRELLFTTPEIGKFISGVILFDETIRQHSSGHVSMPEVIKKQDMIPGIKVDRGAKDFALFPGEKVTEGLDGLRNRLAEYKHLGAQFTKWRAVIRIDRGIPTRTCLEANANFLAYFAALSQEAGLTPIVEPEVLMEGDHTIGRSEEITSEMLRAVFHALVDHRVALEAMLLKPNMVTPGTDCPEKASVDEIATATLRCLRRSVPSAVPGIVFLSGGQSEVDATTHLSAINREGNTPWELGFSFGRALQTSALKTWNGRPENISAAQKVFAHRAECNSLARNGEYHRTIEEKVQ